MAFDFSSRDERIYIAATEDGWIHRCSTSYSEQYLESYSGHMVSWGGWGWGGGLNPQLSYLESFSGHMVSRVGWGWGGTQPSYLES
eukprot:362037-Chlamydomonas_euryale.AAC.2